MLRYLALPNVCQCHLAVARSKRKVMYQVGVSLGSLDARILATGGLRVVLSRHLTCLNLNQT